MKCRAYLLHLTHYDPGWIKNKGKEKRFHRKTAEACIRAIALAGFNFLIIDIKDAVIYKSLPHLKRNYSVPMRELKELVELAKSLGLEVVPKLNFSKSNIHRHSQWLWNKQRESDTSLLWKDAVKAIDEIITATKPRFFHIGMDEDDTRSPEEYANALKFLYGHLKKRKIRMVMWAECGHNWRQTERWKEIPAIMNLPRDVILMLWSYHLTLEDWVQKLQRKGFDVIGTSASLKLKDEDKRTWYGENTRDWLKVLKKNKSFGHCLTRWIPTSSKNKSMLMEGIRETGKLFSEF